MFDYWVDLKLTDSHVFVHSQSVCAWHFSCWVWGWQNFVFLRVHSQYVLAVFFARLTWGWQNLMFVHLQIVRAWLFFARLIWGWQNLICLCICRLYVPDIFLARLMWCWQSFMCLCIRSWYVLDFSLAWLIWGWQGVLRAHRKYVLAISFPGLIWGSCVCTFAVCTCLTSFLLGLRLTEFCIFACSQEVRAYHFLC